MNGKEYIVETIHRVETLLPAFKDREGLSGDPILGDLSKACESLNNIKNKATLRTKDGTNMAFPTNEAGKDLQDEWEEVADGDHLEMLKEQIETFVDTVQALVKALEDRNIILT